MLCAEGRRSLEGWSEKRRFWSAAEGKELHQMREGERDDEANEEDGQEREPVRLGGAMAVGNDECDQGNGDRCHCDPEPHAFLAEGVHR